MWIAYAEIAICAVVVGSLLGLLFSYTGKIQRKRTAKFESQVSELAARRATEPQEGSGFGPPSQAAHRTPAMH